MTAWAAGVDRTTPFTQQWQETAGFLEAVELAKQMAGERLRDEAVRRAVEGEFEPVHDMKGRSLEHPDDCDCGHRRLGHGGERGRGGKCKVEGCECARFEGAPVYRRKTSDKLLLELLKANLPEEFGDKSSASVEVNAILANLDMSRLPDAALVRIQAREHPLAVLASLVEGDAYARELLGLPELSGELGPINPPGGEPGD